MTKEVHSNIPSAYRPEIELKLGWKAIESVEIGKLYGFYYLLNKNGIHSAPQKSMFLTAFLAILWTAFAYGQHLPTESIPRVDSVTSTNHP